MELGVDAAASKTNRPTTSKDHLRLPAEVWCQMLALLPVLACGRGRFGITIVARRARVGWGSSVTEAPAR